jgi:hypothetical protein
MSDSDTPESPRDPVEIVERVLSGEGKDPDVALYEAETSLKELRGAGWRIVRTSTCECGQPDAIHGGAERYPTEERIVEEWSDA